MSKPGAARRTLLIMMAVFAVPYFLSWVLYLNPGVIGLGTRNNGTLISPVIAPEAVHLSGLDGQPYQVDVAAGKWTLMMFGSSQCEKACKKTLFTLQQLRKMMGVDKARIRRVYVLLDSATPALIQAELKQFAGTDLQFGEDGLAQFLEQKLKIGTGQLREHIIIADPMGNLVMWYPQDIDPRKIFADIEILFGRVKNV